MAQPAEGERSAATGLRAQYRVAAELVLANLRNLEWIKVADPDAGKADDFQLATISNELHALQVRWSIFASPYGFGRLVDGSEPLVRSLAGAWLSLRASNPGRSVHVHVVSNNHAATGAAVQSRPAGEPAHFAAFIARGLIPIQRLLRNDREADVTAETAFTDWNDAWNKLRSATGLDEKSFWEFVADFELNLGVTDYAFTEKERRTPRQLSDLAHVADVLFETVADPEHIVQLSRAELIDRLGWTRRLTYRNRHVFPVPAAYEPNESAVARLVGAIEANRGGYFGLVAAAGAGKSTLLTATELPAKRTFHYYAFTPDAPDPSTGRGESENFFFDVVTALDNNGLYTPDVVDPTDRLDLKERLLQQLDAAHREWEEEGHRSIIVVDGLDHIPREQNPHRSLIDDLPDPGQVPEGVCIIVGAQTTDVLPPAIKHALAQNGRTIDVPPLTDDQVLAVATNAGPGTWLDADHKRALIDAVEGHPLALTYLLEELGETFVDPAEGATVEARTRADAILSAGSEYRGDVQARYEGYWERIAGHHDLHNLLGITARLRSPISLEWLMTWNDATVVDGFAVTAAPFFIKDDHSWTFIHNSFRLFLRSKTALIGNAYSDERNRQLHAQAADICAAAEGRWISYRDEELAQRLHAEQHERVLELAAPQRLRARLHDLAPPGAVALDVDLALQSAVALTDATAVLKLALMKFELEQRAFILEPHEVAFNLIQLGEYENALTHVVAGRELRLGPAKALEASTRLLRADRIADAGEIIRVVGPLRSLLETTQQHPLYDRDTASLIQWWVAAHSRTRPLEDVLSDVDHQLPPIQPPFSPDGREQHTDDEDASDQYRTAALWQLSAEAASSDDATARSKILLAASQSDPLSAASAELQVETDGSTNAIVERVDSALANFGVKPDVDEIQRWAPDEVSRVPARIRIRAAELLIEEGAPPEMARGLVAGCELPADRDYGDEERRNLWRGYRLHRLRHIVSLEAEGDTAVPTDAGMILFVRALRQLAELDASVWRSRIDPDKLPGPVMTTVRQLHRLYEIPVRERRGWTGWYVAQGTAPEFFQRLIEVAMAGDATLAPSLWDLFIGAWNDPARSPYWSLGTRIAVLCALGDAGVAADKIISQLEAIAGAVQDDPLEAHERTEILLDLSRTFSDCGARDQARKTLRASVQGSLAAGVHDKDYQLDEWVERFGEYVRAAPEAFMDRRIAIAMAQRLAWAKVAGASTDNAGTALLRIIFEFDPGLAVDMAEWLTEHDVLDGRDALAGLIGGAAEDPDVPADLVAEVVRSIYMPAAVHPMPEVATRLIGRGGDEIRKQLEDGVRRWVLPTLRSAWGAAISQGAATAPPTWIGDPPERSTEETSASEPASVRLHDGTRLSESEAEARVSSKRELFELLRATEAPSDSYSTTPATAAVRKIMSEVESADVDPLLEEFRRVRINPSSYAALAAAMVTRYGMSAAQPVIAEARRAISMRGWSDFWDGGTRRKFWAEVVSAGGDELVREAMIDLATALRVDAIQLSALMHNLPNVLPIIGLDAVSAWPVINDYLTILCRPRGSSKWEPLERGGSSTVALLRHVAGYTGHPVRALEWGARNVLRAALIDPHTATDAATVISEASGGNEAADEALLSVIVAADGPPAEARDIFADAVMSTINSTDQIVRDVGERAANSLGLELDLRAKRPLPLSYTLAVPPLPDRSRPLLDDEGVAILDPLNPRSHLSTYDVLLEGPVARFSELEPQVLVRQAARLADEYAERVQWTRGGVKAHAQRIKATGWLQGYRPWALMVGRRGAAAVIAHLADARMLPDPWPLTMSERLEMVDPELEFVEPEARPPGVLRPARRDRHGADSGDWIADTADAARIYAQTPSADLVAGEWMDWSEFSWKIGRERRVSALRFPTGELLSGDEVEASPRPGVMRTIEKAMALGAFETAGGYRRYVEGEPELNETPSSLVVGGQAWWAELRWGEWLALNPDIALALGWRLSETGLFRWVNDADDEMARSRWWTQGLTTHQPPHFEDDAGEGWQVLLSTKGWGDITERFGHFEYWSGVARAIKNREELAGDVVSIRPAAAS